MAYPFGGHPLLTDYIRQAQKNHGAIAKSSSTPDDAGKVHEATRIEVPGTGTSVVVVGIRQTERLTPSMVGYLDRRLNIISPWFSIDPVDDQQPQ